MNDSNPDLNESMAAMTERELLIALGRELAERERNLRLPGPGELAAKGQVWLDSHLYMLQDKLCKSHEIRSIVAHEDAALVTAVADLIASYCIGVSPVTVAYLLCKREIGSLCSEIWNETPG